MACPLRLLLLSADVPTASKSNPNGSITYDRHSFNAIVPKADLVEYYLPAWEACATEGKAGSVMCSCEKPPRTTRVPSRSPASCRQTTR